MLLITSFLKMVATSPLLATHQIGSFILKYSHGSICVNTEQKTVGLKLLSKILSMQTPDQSALSLSTLLSEYDLQDKQLQSIPNGHEQKLSLLYRETLRIQYTSEENERLRSAQRFLQMASLSVSGKMGSNAME
jgi:hypothetical protein